MPPSPSGSWQLWQLLVGSILRAQLLGKSVRAPPHCLATQCGHHHTCRCRVRMEYPGPRMSEAKTEGETRHHDAFRSKRLRGEREVSATASEAQAAESTVQLRPRRHVSVVPSPERQPAKSWHASVDCQASVALLPRAAIGRAAKGGARVAKGSERRCKSSERQCWESSAAAKGGDQAMGRGPGPRMSSPSASRGTCNRKPHARLFSRQRTLSVRILTDVNVGSDLRSLLRRH